jgi:prophage endopeptidase
MGSLLSGLFGSWWAYLIAGALIAAGAAFATHQIDSNHYNTIIAQNQEKALADQKAVSDAAAAASAKNLQELQQEVADLQADSAARYKDLQDAQTQNDQLRADVADGARRLSIASTHPSCGNSVSKASSAGPVVHDTYRCDIDPAAGQRIITIVNDGDDAIRKLAACQAYVKRIVLPETATQSR